MSNKTNKLIQNNLDLLELKKIDSTTLFLKSIEKTFSLNVKRFIFLFVFFIIFFVILKYMMFPYNLAIKILYKLLGDINIIIIPIFAVIITGYAIFQALINGSAVITLLTVKHKNKESKFEIYNLYFFGLACCYLILIIINFILQFIFKNINPNWSLSFLSSSENELIAAILISFYLVVVLYFLIEIKSFIYNLFQVFITSASETSIEHLKKQKE